MTSDTPPPRDLSDHAPIKTQDDLCQFWRRTMGELGFSRRCLWIAFLEPDGQVLPGIIQLDFCPPRPDRVSLTGLMDMIVQMLHYGPRWHSVAFLWSRPGGAATEPDDLAWAHMLSELANKAMIAHWPIHHANDYDLRVFAPDELAA